LFLTEQSHRIILLITVPSGQGASAEQTSRDWITTNAGEARFRPGVGLDPGADSKVYHVDRMSQEIRIVELAHRAGNGIWDVGVSRDSAGWTAEFRIPFQTLRFQVGEDT